MATGKPAGSRWYAVVFWGLLSALALPVWLVGVLAAAFKAPLRYSAQRLNAELRRPRTQGQSGASSASKKD